MKTLTKFDQLNFIGDIFQPKYSTKTVIIATWKIKRSKLDIKLRFSDVGETSEYYGDWFLPRAKALKYKSFNNNGLDCKEIPMSAFDKIIIEEDRSF